MIEGGRIVYEGTAAELKEHPERLHSAYLLRERGDAADGARGGTSERAPALDAGRARRSRRSAS